MKAVGLIGGIAPESTIEYYRLIVAGYRARVTDGSYPSILINSINLKAMLELGPSQRVRPARSSRPPYRKCPGMKRSGPRGRSAPRHLSIEY